MTYGGLFQIRALLEIIPNWGLTGDYSKFRALLGTIPNSHFIKDYFKLGLIKGYLWIGQENLYEGPKG